MKKLITIISVSALLIMPIDTQAQNLLKGLREKAEKGISGALGSILGEEAPKQEAPKQEAPQRQSTPKQTQTTQRIWDDSQVKPSTAKDAKALYAEFPSFPTESQASSEDAYFQYKNKIASIKARNEQLKNEVPVSIEDQMKMANNYSDEFMAKQSGMTLEQYREMKAESSQNAAMGNAFFGSLEMKALENPEELERVANSMDMDKMNTIEEEMEKINKKKNKTAADEKRLKELEAEYMELASPMIELMGGMDALMGASAKAEQAKASTPKEKVVVKNDFDKEFDAVYSKLDELEAIIRSSQSSRTVSERIGSYFQKIWAEPAGSSNVKTLYAELFEYMDGNGADAAARARLNKKYYDQATGMLDKAFYFAENASKAEYYPKSQVLQFQYNMIELIADIYDNVFNASDLSFEPVTRVEIDIEKDLESYERVYFAESFYNLMDATNISFSNVNNSAKGLAEEFKCKSTFLIYNNRDGNYYSYKCGQRTKLTVKSGQRIDFSKELDQSGLKTETIKMNSSDKTITLRKNGTLELPGENYYFPVAISRSSEWLEFIERDGGSFYLCKFRL